MNRATLAYAIFLTHIFLAPTIRSYHFILLLLYDFLHLFIICSSYTLLIITRLPLSYIWYNLPYPRLLFRSRHILFCSNHAMVHYFAVTAIIIGLHLGRTNHHRVTWFFGLSHHTFRVLINFAKQRVSGR